jgi:DNA topoisomerase-1
MDPFSVDDEQAIEIIEEKKKADAPITTFKGEGVTKGTGRFGNFIKYDGMFINVPKRYNFEDLSQKDIDELIEAKIEKEANRYIQRWEDEKISIENARWGPIIKHGKNIHKIPKTKAGEKYEVEDLKEVVLEEVKKWITAQDKNAFKEKAKPKKAAAKKPAAKKKPVAKKAPVAKKK